MNFLPIVHRELSLSAGRTRTYWTRFGAAGVVSVILLSMALSHAPTTTIGRMMFNALSVLALGYCLLAGVLYTADALSRERREGTLGLLFLTNLRGFDVVLGKLAATSLDALFVLLAICPLLGIPVLMGGVTGTEFWRVVLLLVNTLFYSLVLGLCVSACGAVERRVTLGTLFLILFMTFGLPLAGTGLRGITNSGWRDWIFLFPSPVHAFKQSAPRFATSPFWSSMLVIFGLSNLLLIGASLVLPRVYQEKNLSPRIYSWARFKGRLHFGATDFRIASRRNLLGANPFLWLISRDRGVNNLLIILSLLTGAFALWAVTIKPTMIEFRIVFLGAFGFHLMIKFLVATEGCRRFNEDKANGVLEMLLCTPLAVDLMLQAQDKRLFRLFLSPLLMVGLINVAIALASLPHVSDGPPIIRAGLTIFVDCWAVARLGMWYGLESKGFARAVFSSLWRVIIPSWILLFLFALSANVSPASPQKVFFWVWFVFVLTYDIWLGTRYRRKLRASFRAVVAGESIGTGEDWGAMNWEADLVQDAGAKISTSS